jgi:imidazole glycerol-phosphate synthase subunit HisF
LIPSLLLRNGRMVKGVRFGDYRDVGHPVTTAKVYDAQGADELLFLDIEATSEERPVLLDVVSRTADECFMPLTVGGGVRTIEDFRALLLAGADKVAINSQAVARPDLISEASSRFGSQCVVVAIDVKGSLHGTVWTHGGHQPTVLKPLDWARRVVDLGAGELIVTSIDREGTRTGYDLELTRAIADAVPVPVIASGGAGKLDDLVDGVREGHASAVSAASIFHFTDQSVIKARSYMRQAGLEMRVA